MLHRVNYEASTATDVDWVSGACMMVRRSALADVGSLDGRFFMYMEDEDWCRRFGEAGYRVVYVPTAGVTHHIGRSSASSSTAAKLYRDSRLIYHKKHNARHYLIYWMLSHLYAARQCAHSRLSGLLIRRSRSAVCSAYSQEG
jgi:GT2 family glycosyltransferase